MRFTTYYSYQNSINYFNQAMAKGFDLNEHIAAGMKNMRPSDAPGNASLAVQQQAALARIGQYEAARNNVKGSLNFEEGVLNTVVNTITSAKSSLVQAGNADMMSEQDRDTMAQSLQSCRDSLLSLANSQNSSGNYIFSGFESSTPAFSDDGRYQGGSEARTIDVEDGYSMAAGHTGDSVFTHGGTSVFTELDNAIDALKDGSLSSDDLHKVLNSATTAMDTMLDNVGNVRSDLGANLKNIDDLSSRAATDTINLQNSLSQTVGNDVTSQVAMISQQSMAQYSLQAAMMAFKSMNSMNLFNLV